MKSSKKNIRFIQFADHSIQFEIDSPSLSLLEVVDVHFTHCLGGVKASAQKVSAYKLTYSDIDQAEAWIRKTLAA